MQFGFTLKPDHSIERTLALTRQAEAAGFDLRLAVRLPRPVAGPVPAADAHGAGHDDACASAPASPTRPPASPPSRRPRWPSSTSSPAGAWTWASGAATPPAASWARRRRR